MTLQAILWENQKLYILDQLLLPETTKYIEIKNVQDGWNAISNMQVRGAPAIAIVGCLSLAAELLTTDFKNIKELETFINEKLDHLISARPTAVNMNNAANRIRRYIHAAPDNVQEYKKVIIERAEEMLQNDISDNKMIGELGAREISGIFPYKKVKILTHCNTGSLATAGYGTALGIIRSLHAMRRIERVYCTETRPYNQGARLTAYELVHEGIPSRLICDNMVAALMQTDDITAVVVGADRVTPNGDTINKIGTYQLAVVAKHHGVPFYVAVPKTSIDQTITNCHRIVIEERPHSEMTHLNGRRIAAEGIDCWNPAFDVTPANLITAIITEEYVYKPDKNGNYHIH